VLYGYIILGKDGNGNPLKYAVEADSYIRRWTRQYTLNLVANIVEVAFIDNGPGLRVYSMTLTLATWPPDSEPYKNGVTLSAEQQMTNLESSYAQLSSSLLFYDAFGVQPTFGSNQPGGVYFTMMNQIIPQYATTDKTYINVQIELTESKQTPI